MTKLEIKKCTFEITDALYEEPGFMEWWNSLDDATEQRIQSRIESIIQKRLNK